MPPTDTATKQNTNIKCKLYYKIWIKLCILFNLYLTVLTVEVTLTVNDSPSTDITLPLYNRSKTEI